MKENNWCLLTSGFGRSAVCILNLLREGKLGQNKIALVIYDNEPSDAHELAESMGIPAVQIKRRHYSLREDFEERILKECREHEIHKIFLLGFNYLLKHSLMDEYQGSIVNVHPSLLPAFKGKRAIQQAMDYGVKVTGITTHFIDDKLDEGEILCQKAIGIDKSMTFEEVDHLFMEAAPQIFAQTMKSI